MAARHEGENWLDLQRQREERMRYEVLERLYRAADGQPGTEVNCWGFASDLGVWHAEVFRVIEFLERHGYLEYLGAGPLVRLTPAGTEYVEGGGEGRSIRG